MSEEENKQRVVMFSANPQVEKPGWSQDKDSDEMIFKPLTKAERLYKNKHHMQKCRNIINKHRFASTSQLQNYLFSCLCSKSSLFYLVANTKHISSIYSTEQDVKNGNILQGQIKSLMMSRNLFSTLYCLRFWARPLQKGSDSVNLSSQIFSVFRSQDIAV